MRITLAQVNALVGGVEQNLSRLGSIVRSHSARSDLIVFPELFLLGYPPRDLLERRSVLGRVEKGLEELRSLSHQHPRTGLLVGLPMPSEAGSGKGLHNSALLLEGGSIRHAAHKSLLPDYDVFDERRYFDPAPRIRVAEFHGERLGITICEDSWNDPDLWPRRPYTLDPMAELAGQGATLLINLSASPFHLGKDQIRYTLLRGHARRHALPLVFVNQVGGNDELIFDGRSLVLDRRGDPVALLPAYREETCTVDLETPEPAESFQAAEPVEAVHGALILGIRDYLHKCGFSRALLGLSGGIDSAVVAALAAEALGPKNVLGVTLPSPHSAALSARLSAELAGNLGIRFDEMSIGGAYRSLLATLETRIQQTGGVSLTMENLQARVRGTVLMALSNERGDLLLATGNKSEMAVGYCTLYGDMCGGLAPLADVPKTMVYELARYMNRSVVRIPRGILERPPTAELRPDQRDQDSLPPYEVLDGILQLYVEEARPVEEIVRAGFDARVVRWVLDAVNRSEFKRRQAAPGLRVTSKAFGAGRRFPIAARHEH